MKEEGLPAQMGECAAHRVARHRDNPRERRIQVQDQIDHRGDRHRGDRYRNADKCISWRIEAEAGKHDREPEYNNGRKWNRNHASGVLNQLPASLRHTVEPLDAVGYKLTVQRILWLQLAGSSVQPGSACLLRPSSRTCHAAMPWESNCWGA